jgi:hypothetical protein
MTLEASEMDILCANTADTDDPPSPAAPPPPPWALPHQSFSEVPGPGQAVAVGEQLKVNEMRRENRLRGMKERQFDEATLHQLFRLFDTDNDHRLTVVDFQTGLVAMGYAEAKDVEVVDVIVQEIDLDRSGNITEAEFVQYFLQRRMEDLELKLSEASREGSSSTVQVIYLLNK